MDLASVRLFAEAASARLPLEVISPDIVSGPPLAFNEVRASVWPTALPKRKVPMPALIVRLCAPSTVLEKLIAPLLDELFSVVLLPKVTAPV